MIKRQTLRILLAILFVVGTPLTMLAGKNIVLKTQEEYYLASISPNGEWACGMYIDYSDNTFGFRWNLITDKVELLSTIDHSEAWGISNEGVVAGNATMSIGDRAPQTVPAYYKDGKWHMLEMPEGNISEGIAYAITPDGKYICGSVVVSGQYNGYVWNDGKLERTIDGSKGYVMPYCISANGQLVGGWQMTDNRQACYWKANGETVFVTEHTSPWSALRRFSPDGKKAILFGGWEEDNGLYCTLNLETNEKGWIKPTVEDGSLELFGLSGNNILVGEHNGSGFLNVDGKNYFVDEYLAEKGVDVSKLDLFQMDGVKPIFHCSDISADGSVLAIRYYANAGTDSDGNPLAAVRSAIIKFDVDETSYTPVVTASAIEGMNTAKIEWTTPVGTEGITGFNVYRDGEKIASVGADVSMYLDKSLEKKAYTYGVTMVRAEGESKMSETTSVIIEERKSESPQSVFVRQKGFNNAYISWKEQKSNLLTRGYTDINTANVQGFGVNADNLSFETAIRFSKNDVAALEGCKLTKVNFFPASTQKNWTLNIYTYDETGTTLKSLYSKPISQELKFGELNTIVLDTPLELPAGELIVGIGVTVEKASQNVFGMDYGKAELRFSDLIRLADEKDFYSISEISSSQGYLYHTSWLMNVIFAPEGAAADIDDLKEYAVTADGEVVLTTNDFEAIVTSIPEGEHEIGVKAIYKNGTESDIAAVTQNIAVNDSYLPAVENLAVRFSDTKDMTVSWLQPQEKEQKYVSYAGETQSLGSIIVPSGYSNIQIAAEYSPSMFKSYKGYKVKSFRFYPIADGLFTAWIYKDNKLVAEQPVENYNLGEWNSVDLAEPITIEEGSTYRLVIDCFDVEGGKEVIAADTKPVYAGKGDLYSFDAETYSSASADSGIKHNFMIGMTLEDTNSLPVPVSGYDVKIDGVKANGETLTTTQFAHSFTEADTKEHTVSVVTFYELTSKSVEGAATVFIIGQDTGISENTVADITLSEQNNELRVMGEGVKKVAIIAADGTQVAEAAGNTVSLDTIPAGIYVVKVSTEGEPFVRKIRINK